MSRWQQRIAHISGHASPARMHLQRSSTWLNHVHDMAMRESKAVTTPCP
jgi:hypothetical protein